MNDKEIDYCLEYLEKKGILKWNPNTGSVELTTFGRELATINRKLAVAKELLEEHGCDNPSKEIQKLVDSVTNIIKKTP